MNKTILFAAAVLSLGAAAITPAFAGEGQGDPFGYSAPSTTRLVRPSGPRFDVGSAQYPDVTGRPGSNLSRLANDDVLPAVGNEAIIQTANSLPRGFEDGTVMYAQAHSMQKWMVAHNRAVQQNLATR